MSSSNFVIENGVLKKYNGAGGEVVIPDGVKSIYYNAFKGCAGLTSIRIPDSVTSIYDYAFKDCAALSSVSLPDSVSEIGRFAFEGCAALTGIDIPHSVTNISHCAFRYCVGLTSVTIPESVTRISVGAFEGCTGLTSITIPDSVNYIGRSAFEGCIELTKIIIPDSVNYIGSSVFDNTGFFNDESNWENGVLYIGNNLIKVKKDISGNFEIRPDTKCIAGGAFSRCYALTGVTIPDSVTSIGDNAFSNCTGLTDIIIPDGITSIDENTFCGCTGLTSVTIPESVTCIGNGAFESCTRLRNISIPDRVTSIGDWAFAQYNEFTVLTIPECVESIGDYAFTLSRLNMLVYPKKKIEIGEAAFSDCVVDQSVIPLDVEWSLPSEFADFHIQNTTPQELAYVIMNQSGSAWKKFLERNVKPDNTNTILSVFLELSEKKKKFKKSIFDNLKAVCSALPESISAENAAAIYALLSDRNPDVAESFKKIDGLFNKS